MGGFPCWELETAGGRVERPRLLFSKPFGSLLSAHGSFSAAVFRLWDRSAFCLCLFAALFPRFCFLVKMFSLFDACFGGRGGHAFGSAIAVGLIFAPERWESASSIRSEAIWTLELWTSLSVPCWRHGVAAFMALEHSINFIANWSIVLGASRVIGLSIIVGKGTVSWKNYWQLTA